MNKQQLQSPPHLPGDLPSKLATERAIRVDHAGELGAVRIYEGQLAVLANTSSARQIHHMAKQEREHLATFEMLLTERKVRPTVLSPLWHVAGFALGAGTAILGEKAAMACTVAVEDVIGGHYSHQIQQLRETEPALCKVLSECKADEAEHRELALDAGAEDAPGYTFLSAAVKTATRTAIWLSERI